MRDPERIDEFCEQLKEYWHRVPDWRFTQLVINVLGVNRYYLEDDDALETFKNFFDSNI